MSQKWNLQDIQPANKQRRKSTAMSSGNRTQSIQRDEESHHSQDQPVGKIEIIDNNRARRKRIVFSIIILFLILITGYTVSLLMSGAEVTIYPKNKDVTVQATFTAHTKPKLEELGYEVLKLEAEGEKQVSAAGEEEVKIQATGQIFIYNTATKVPQRLVPNTRFETPAGLIFKIKDAIEIPGTTEDAEGNILPGIRSAEVFAAEVGDEYNIKPTKFTVPGLKGTDQFDLIYAESTESMSGGFNGPKFIIAEDELITAKQSLHTELRNVLLERLKLEKPQGLIVYDNAVTFSFESLPSTTYGDNLVTIKEKVSLYVPLFKESEFAQYLAQNGIVGYENEPVTIDDPYLLTFSYPTPTTTLDSLIAKQSFDFNLSGGLKIIWTYDEEILRNDITGITKTALPTILTGYPALTSAEGIVRPFWKKSFPNDPDKIDIIKVIRE